jgi:hypothetical protein
VTDTALACVKYFLAGKKSFILSLRVNSVVAKLNRRKGQLQRPTVLNGVEKAASEQETFDFICLLVRSDSQLKQVLQWNH